MKSLSEYVEQINCSSNNLYINTLLESSIERYSIKITLKQFLEKYMELSKLSKNKAISELVYNLNMYSVCGHNKED